MKPFTVGYFDGRVSTRQEVLLTLDREYVTIRGNEFHIAYPLASISVPPGVGSVRRTMRLPDGGLCELEDDELIAALELASGGANAQRLVHRWEKSLPLALGALALTAVLVLLFLRYGVPTMARQAAFALPPATESTIGRESLATLDHLLMKPSRLAPERRAALTALFRREIGPQGEAAGYRLEFRSCPAVGANAFALPAGIVIITDDMVSLAKNDDEIAAVMAHELGHVRSRHALRQVLQSSATGLIMATLTGDLVSITSLAATLPTVLVETSFSREFEREADAAAIAWMKKEGVPPRRYAEILARLQAQLDTRHGEAIAGKNPARNYLSTHPDTGERIKRIMKESGE